MESHLYEKIMFIRQKKTHEKRLTLVEKSTEILTKERKWNKYTLRLAKDEVWGNILLISFFLGNIIFLYDW